jgi:hypothetical protein
MIKYIYCPAVFMTPVMKIKKDTYKNFKIFLGPWVDKRHVGKGGNRQKNRCVHLHSE